MFGKKRVFWLPSFFEQTLKESKNKYNELLKKILSDKKIIVMIDEVDMHLHPQWQQTILDQLRKVFVNLQFIVTTHSPQVLTTVEPECIRAIYLNPENNRYEYKIPDFSKGAESIQVLEDIFNVRSRPPQIEEVQLLREYEELVEIDEWDSERAIEIRKILDQWGKNRDTVLDKLDTRISLKRFKRSR